MTHSIFDRTPDDAETTGFPNAGGKTASSSQAWDIALVRRPLYQGASTNQAKAQEKTAILAASCIVAVSPVPFPLAGGL
jgi:hypothetical protein